MSFQPFVPRVDVNSLRASETAVNTLTAAVLVTGTTIFNVFGGPINLLQLVSICTTGNDATASTLQWSADGTDGAATTFTGASASLASALAGAAVVCNLTAVSTAPDILAAGVGLGGVVTRGIIIPAGIITTTVGVGSTTGKWLHYIRFKPMGLGVSVVPAF